MPTLQCESCRGSGYDGVIYKLDKIDDEVSLECIELKKCSTNCRDGFVFKVDDESYNTKDSVRE